MSLSAAPTFTPGSTGNIYGGSGGASLAASASTIQGPFYVGVAGQTGAQGTTTTGSAVSGSVQVINKGGSAVASTNGLTVQVFRSVDGGTIYDTIPYTGTYFTIPATANTATPYSFDLPPGQYQIKFTNLDATNAITQSLQAKESQHVCPKS